MCVVSLKNLVSVRYHSLYFSPRNQLLSLTNLTENRIYLSSKIDKRKIAYFLYEFFLKIVLSALAAQDSSTEILTVVWIANRVHIINSVRQGAASCSKTTPAGIEPFCEKPSSDPPLKWGEVSNTGKVGSLSQIKYYFRHSA